MKKLISPLAVAALLFAGATSCNEPGGNGNPDEGKTGALKVNFGITENPVSRAIAKSSARPITTWGDVANLMILFTDGTTVQDARVIEVPASTAALSGQSATFVDVKANSTTGWTAYIVGNHPAAWNVGYVVGKPLSALTIGSPTAALGNGLTGNGIGEVPEIFVARETGVIIDAGNATNTHANAFKLGRAVSMVRVRIERDGLSPSNATIDFSDAVFAVRRATTTYGLSGTYTYTTPDAVRGATAPGSYTLGAATDVFYSARGLSNANPSAADYENAATIIANGVDFWNDYMVWSGGSDGGSPTENNKRFDIVIGGKTTTNNYVNVQGNTLGIGEMVYWTGAVNGHMGPNQILELVITLNTAGSVTPPEVGQYGDLEIDVDLLPWGDIIGVDMPL